jgi:hypothetical protein
LLQAIATDFCCGIRLTETGFVMTEEQNKTRPEVTPEDESLYTQSFARERARKSRRNSLYLGIGALIYGGLIVHDTVIAIPTGKLVELGGQHRHGIELPPFLAGPIGVIAILVGLWLLAGLVFGRK